MTTRGPGRKQQCWKEAAILDHALAQWCHGMFPELRFEQDQKLTSFAGLIVFQRFFALIDLKAKLRDCFKHIGTTPIFGHGTVALLLIVHVILGYRRLRDITYYDDDPMVLRVLGLRRLPDVATISRSLAATDDESVTKLGTLMTNMGSSA